MLNLNTQTPSGRALAALAEEFMGAVKWTGLIAVAKPFVEEKIRELVERTDANPEATRAALRPLVMRLVTAFEISADELYAETPE